MEFFITTVIFVCLNRIHCSLAVSPSLPWLTFNLFICFLGEKKNVSMICYWVEKYRLFFLSLSLSVCLSICLSVCLSLFNWRLERNLEVMQGCERVHKPCLAVAWHRLHVQRRCWTITQQDDVLQHQSVLGIQHILLLHRKWRPACSSVTNLVLATSTSITCLRMYHNIRNAVKARQQKLCNVCGLPELNTTPNKKDQTVSLRSRSSL